MKIIAKPVKLTGPYNYHNITPPPIKVNGINSNPKMLNDLSKTFISLATILRTFPRLICWRLCKLTLLILLYIRVIILALHLIIKLVVLKYAYYPQYIPIIIEIIKGIAVIKASCIVAWSSVTIIRSLYNSHPFSNLSPKNKNWTKICQITWFLNVFVRAIIKLGLFRGFLNF